MTAKKCHETFGEICLENQKKQPKEFTQYTIEKIDLNLLYCWKEWEKWYCFSRSCEPYWSRPKVLWKHWNHTWSLQGTLKPTLDMRSLVRARTSIFMPRSWQHLNCLAACLPRSCKFLFGSLHWIFKEKQFSYYPWGRPFSLVLSNLFLHSNGQKITGEVNTTTEVRRNNFSTLKFHVLL